MAALSMFSDKATDLSWPTGSEGMTPHAVGVARGDTVSPRKTRMARLSRTISCSSSRPIRFPSLDFGTVVILSTIKRLAKRKRLCSFGSMSNRKRGRRSHRLKAQMVIEEVDVEAVILHDDHWPRFVALPPVPVQGSPRLIQSPRLGASRRQHR
jgi:hypothetical protein